MTQLEIYLTMTTAILAFATLASNIIWFRLNKKRKKEIKKLKHSLSAIKSANSRLKEQNDLNTVRSASALNRTLHLWREETDELRSMLAQKEQLLQQKWAVAKDAVSE